MGNAYSALAGVYDRLMSDFDYNGYYGFVKEHIQGDVVELGCGSGEFTALYASKANSVIACDINRRMLDIAASKCLRYRRTTVFVESDMAKLRPYRRVDTVIAVCDGFNYLPQVRLTELLKNVSAYLKKGGKLIFDVSSQYKLVNVIGCNVFYEDYDDLTYIWTNSLHDSRVDMDITVFQKQGEYYLRSDESQTQYVHSADTLTWMLSSYGFETRLYDGESYAQADAQSKRLLFICTLLS